MKIQMNKITGISLLIAIFFVEWLFITVPTAATLQSLQVGFEAPDFSLKSFSGETRKFADLKGGKLTVLVFWASWSPRSEQALAKMQSLYKKYKDQGLSVVGINVESQQMTDDSLAKARVLTERLKIEYPLLIDHGLASFQEYGVIAVPTTVVLDGDRIIKFELSSFPLIGSEDMVDYITSEIEGKKPSERVTRQTGYRPDKKAVRFLYMGHNSLKSKRMAETAEKWYKQAIEADPKFVAPHLSLGSFYLKRDQVALAKEQYEQAIAKEAGNVIALCELGMIMANDGKIEEGRALMDRALKIEEAYTPCHYYLGHLYGREGKLQEALGMFDSAARINPMDYKIYVYKARMFEESRKLREAAENYRKVFELISKE